MPAFPAGGADGEALVKARNSNYATRWEVLSGTLIGLTTFLADNTGARVAGTDAVFQSASGDYLVRGELTDERPRFGFQLADGRALAGIYQDGYDVTSDFTAGANRTYIHNYDVGAGVVQYLIRTREV